MKDLTRWGFDKKVCNADKLDKIWDLLEGKVTVRDVGFGRFIVWEDDAITDEVKELQKGLTKKWYTYSNYKIEELKYLNGRGMPESEFLKKKEEYEKKEAAKKKKAEERKKKQAIKENSDRGIYGIYCNDKLIYIGKTNVSFEARFKQHKEAVESKSTIQFLYKYIVQQKEQNNAEITMKPLVNIKELKVKGKITNRDIEAMELALIDLYKPICNIQGVKQDYEFS